MAIDTYTKDTTMKFTSEFTEAADKFFGALKKLGATMDVVENSAVAEVAEVAEVVAEVPAVAEVAEVTNEVPAAEVAEVVAEVPAVDEIAELKKAVTSLQAELAKVQTNLNSTLDANTELVDKLSIILGAPKTDMIEVKNSRPTEVKQDFTAWDAALNEKLNNKK